MQDARAIDDYYDSMLVDGMSAQAAELVEQMRASAHDQLRQRIVSRAREFGGPSPARFAHDDDPIRRIF